MVRYCSSVLLVGSLFASSACDLDWPRFELPRNVDASLRSDADVDAGEDAGPAPVPSGLVLHLPFDEGSGATTRERIEDIDAPIRGGASFVSDGALGSALRFDGVDGDVRVPLPEVLSLGQTYTVSVWLRLPADATGPVMACAGDPQFALKLGDSERLLEGVSSHINTPMWTDYIVSSSTAEVAVDSWQHAALVVDRGMLRLYVGGAEVDSKTVAAPSPTPPTEAACYVGQNSLDDPGYLRGDVDDLRIYDRPLDMDEIGDLADMR